MIKQLTTKICLIIFLLVCVNPLTGFSQNLTGIWRGYFITENYSQYKFEIQIKQTPDGISGVSYSYLSTVFYGKASLTGNFNKGAGTALIREIKTTELKMAGGSAACIMKCLLEYSKSGKEEFLDGSFSSAFEQDDYGTKKGDDCGGGKVFLRKVTTSDFYVEPFLRPSLTPPPATSKPKSNPPVVNKPVTKPKPPVVVNKPPVTKTPTEKAETVPAPDSVQKVSKPPVIKKTGPVTIPSVLKNRANELVKTFVVRENSITVKLFDNGEIDGDTISVYLNKRLVLSNKMLTTTALVINLKLDEDNPDHELVMVAENLGRIPPNTSLMIVEAGDQRFDVRITSTEQKNAVVRFRYEKAD